MLTKDHPICTFVNSTKQNYENNSIETNLNSIYIDSIQSKLNWISISVQI